MYRGYLDLSHEIRIFLSTLELFVRLEEAMESC